MTKRQAVPAIPGVSGGVEAAVRAITEIHKVREGDSTKPLERFVTLGELKDAGIASVSLNGRRATITPRPPGAGNVGGGSIPYDLPDLGLNDLTPPPMPTGIRARGIGEKNVMVTWQIPAFSNAYYTEIYRTPFNNLGQLTDGFLIGFPYQAISNPNTYYRGRSFGNSFLDTLDDEDPGNPWFYWVRYISAARVPSPFPNEGKQASKTIDPDEFLEDFQGTTPLLMDEEGNVGIRGDLVVKGLVTANDVDVRGLLTAKEIWAKSIVGLEATFDNVVGQRVIVGPRYIQDVSGAKILDTADTPLNGTSGQWRLALNNPLSSYNVGADGKVRIIHYYKPTFTGGVEAAVVPPANEAFYLDNEGNVFVGGNLTIRTQGSPAAAVSGTMMLVGGNGAGVNNAAYYRNPTTGALVEYPAYNRFAMWVGRKSDFLADGAKESNGILWVREGVDSDGEPKAGFNAGLFLGGSPFSQPSMIGFTQNPGAGIINKGNTFRATTLAQDVLSADSFEAKTYLNANGVEQFPPMMITINCQFVAHDSGTTDGGDSKMGVITAEVVSTTNTTTAVALIQQICFDDWIMNAAPMSMMGVVQLPAGHYKIRIRVRRIEDRNLSILAGWRAMVYHSVASGDFNLIENGSVVGKDWPAPLPLANQGYYQTP